MNIAAISNQLQKQGNNQYLSSNDYYSSITILNIKYSCETYIANGLFCLTLYYPLNNSIINFYGESEEFLCRHYSNGDFYIIKDKDYKYALTVSLNEKGQYYEYCSDNNIKFPNTIILYGYESK